MKGKKILAIVLSAIMLIGSLATVSAEGTATEVSSYDAFVEALSTGGNITVLSNFTVDTAVTVSDGTTIDLNGKTLNWNVENSYFGTSTIKNGNIVFGKNDVHVCDGYFIVNEGKTLTIDGANITSSASGMKCYAAFHLKTGAVLNIQDSLIDVANNEYSAGYIVYANEATAKFDLTDSILNSKNVAGVVHAETTITDSSVTIEGTGTMEHGINRSAVTITDSTVTISGGTGRGITAQHGDLVIDGNSQVTVYDMDEATIELRNDKSMTVADIADVVVDVDVNNTTAGTITGTVTVQTVPMGTITYGYTRQDAVWGEATSNSGESFYIELYAGEDKIATTTLNNVGGIIDGDLYVTWSIPFAGSTDEYWTVEWEDGHPTARVQPTKVVLYSDGVMVAENTVQMNGPDNLNPVEWRELEALNLQGEGTTENPYLINNPKELKMFRDDVNDGDAYNGKIVKLTADIDLNNEEWTPIGNSTNKFQGTFDGDNHTISNLLITGYNSNVGLFGFTTNGEVKNLTVNNAKVSGRLNVGVVAGTPYTSKYTNISVTGHVEVNGMAYVGGVGGKNAYANWTDITVDVDDTSYVKAYSIENETAYRTYVGGVIGFMGEGSHTVKNVTSNIDVIGSTCDVGGIVGIAHYGNNFINCSSSGNVHVENANESEIGGIAGVWHNGGSPVIFENCSFTGNTYIAGEKVNVAISGPGYSANGTGIREIKGTVTLNGVEKESLAQAIAEANEMSEPAVIDILGNNATLDKAYVLNNDITFKNGMLIFDNYNGLDPSVYDPAGIYYAVMTIGADVTFDNVILTGKNAVANQGVFVLATDGIMSLTNGSELNVTAPTSTAVIYSEGEGKLVVNGSKINIDGDGNAVRGMLSLRIDADNAEITVKNITDNAMRNVKGTVDNSTITVDGAEYGIKNTADGDVLTVTDSTIKVTNTVNESENAGIYLTGRDKLDVTNSIIDAKIFIDGSGEDTVLVTLNFETNGGDIINSLEEEVGSIVDLSVYKPTKNGYVFIGWYSDEAMTEKVTQVTLNEPTTIYAKWNQREISGGASVGTKYTLSFETDGGTALSRISRAKNTTVDLTNYITEKNGYIFEGWYTDKEFNNPITSVKLTDNTTVYAKWTKETETDEPVIGEKGLFADVKEDDWFYENVKYVVENKLMNGVSKDNFMPNDTLTRAMLVTILYRLDDEPEIESISFADVDKDAYYANAVSWAKQNGIVNGVTENEFAPNANISREQIAAIIYRYAQFKGYNVSVVENTNLFSYDDAEIISEYAVSSMKYAVGSGLVNGKSVVTLNPKDNATRAEIAAILQRFIETNKR